MARFKKSIVTNKAINVLANLETGNQQLRFFGVKVTTDDLSKLSVDEIKNLTELNNIAQEYDTNAVYVENNDTVNVNIILSNEKLKADYDIGAIGLYASQDFGKTLFLYSVMIPENGKITMSAGNGTDDSSLAINYKIKVSADNIAQIITDSSGRASLNDIDILKKDTNNKIDGINKDVVDAKQDLNNKINQTNSNLNNTNNRVTQNTANINNVNSSSVDRDNKLKNDYLARFNSNDQHNRIVDGNINSVKDSVTNTNNRIDNLTNSLSVNNLIKNASFINQEGHNEIIYDWVTSSLDKYYIYTPYNNIDSYNGSNYVVIDGYTNLNNDFYKLLSSNKTKLKTNAGQAFSASLMYKFVPHSYQFSGSGKLFLALAFYDYNKNRIENAENGYVQATVSESYSDKSNEWEKLNVTAHQPENAVYVGIELFSVNGYLKALVCQPVLNVGSSVIPYVANNNDATFYKNNDDYLQFKISISSNVKALIEATKINKSSKLKDGDDLDKITNSGTYYNGVAKVSNLPNIECTWSVIEVINSYDLIVQKVFVDPHKQKNGVCFRIYSGNPETWSKWILISGETV